YVMAGRAPGRIAAMVDTAARRAGPAAQPGAAGPAANPAAAFRGSPRYFELCVELRRALESAEGSA
ncbi:MAG: hypothetical protein JNG85_05695, partial [Spirochaetaceae bacterium]|nr:hypothetical protein [Spirochaetaceae bacterium]